MIDKIPPGICQDAAHSEIIIILLLVAVGWLVKLYRAEKKKNQEIENNWKDRVENKLDTALANHEQCQRILPEKYVSKQEFTDLLKERNHQWDEFNKKFESLIERFWNHKHCAGGDVERMK